MTRLLPATLLLLTLAGPAPAADVRPAETYWQRLPGVWWVTPDEAGNPVFHTADGYFVAATGKFVPRGEDVGGHQLYAGRSGRLWLRDFANSVTFLWDGGKWEKLDHAPRRVFEDSSGRGFLFDGKDVRVRGTDGKWAAQHVSDKPHLEEAYFVEHGGRVWLWGSREKPGSLEGMLGVWSYADGTWTHHTTKAGLPFDSVKWMHPVSDGRFLLVADRPAGEAGVGTNATAFWHPDRKLPEAETVVPGAKDRPLVAWGDPVGGTDGTLYLNVLQGKRPGRAKVAVSAKGEVRELTEADHDALRRIPQARIDDRNVVFGKLGEVPPLPLGEGGFLCADRHGRYYFRPSTGHPGEGIVRAQSVSVVWPKFEKPGDVLRLEPEPTPVTRIVRDAAGVIWAEPELHPTGLLRWDGAKWADTPVKPLYHPRWIARPAPPWNPWAWRAGHLFRLHGKDGSLLVARVRDVYQREQPPAEDVRVPALPVIPPQEDGKPPYWLEGWLYRGGKWTGPADVRKLLTDERAALAADFPARAGEAGFFTLVNDGNRLWAAFDGKVLCVEKDGAVTEADAPGPKSKLPLPEAMLALLPDGRVLLAGPAAGEGHTLAVKEGKIAAEAFEVPKLLPASPAVRPAQWRLAKDGTLWAWAHTDRGGTAAWRFRDGKWAEEKELGEPFHEDADGSLWFHPRVNRAHSQARVLIASGTSVKELEFAPEDQRVGFTDVPRGSAVWANGDRLVRLDPAGPDGKFVLRWRVLPEPAWGTAGVAIDDKGIVLLGRFRGPLQPVKP